MARKKSKRQKQKPKKPEASEKRDTLKLLRNGAVAAIALGGAGLVSVRAVRATLAEQDLSIIGTGVPTIVQIHDPQCALCTELQRQTRRALRGFDSEEIAYRIASIRTQEGAAFANRHGLAHVTLMLIDGDGGIREVIEGVQDASDLRPRFEALVSAPQSGS